MAPITIAASLKSLGDEVILPDNLLPDDTTLFYDDDGNPESEWDLDDPDDEAAENFRERYRYADVILAYYNGKHETDYKSVKFSGGGLCNTYRKKVSDNPCSDHSKVLHCGFFAAPRQYVIVDCQSSVIKYFCAELDPYTYEVFSCRILDGITTSCEFCDLDFLQKNFDEHLSCERGTAPRSRKSNVPPLSEYSQYLAEGVTLSDKAKLRVRFALLALAYYNKKQHKDYKLVDVLPNCESYEDSFVTHCNFIARQSACDDASNKLFFAELVKGKGDYWVVFACRIVRGKTTAGCHNCPDHRGKRVIHPTRGFHFGLDPDGLDPLAVIQLRLRLR